VYFTNYELSSYILYHSHRFVGFDLSAALGGADLNNAVEIRDYYEVMMMSQRKFFSFLSRVYGIGWTSEKMMRIIGPWYIMFSDYYYSNGYLCLETFYLVDDPDLKTCYSNVVEDLPKQNNCNKQTLSPANNPRELVFDVTPGKGDI